MIDKKKVKAGRKAVNEYRKAHTQLHNKPWNRNIPHEHTPLFAELLARLKKSGFNSLEEFFEASDELNILEPEKAWR